MNGLSRRTLLAAGCAGCAAVTVGCAAGNDGDHVTELRVPLSDLPVGTTRVFADRQIALTRTGEATVVAYSALCPHQGCAVAVVDGQLKGPCHGSKFDTTTGAVVRGPARSGLETRTVTVDDDTIVA